MTIKDLAHKYIKFMKDVGRQTTEDVFELIPLYFSSNITKIENGKLIATDYGSLNKQLLEARKAYSPWEILVIDILCDDKAKKAVVRFVGKSEKPELGSFSTVVTLIFDNENKIKEINELFTKLAPVPEGEVGILESMHEDQPYDWTESISNGYVFKIW